VLGAQLNTTEVAPPYRHNRFAVSFSFKWLDSLFLHHTTQERITEHVAHLLWEFVELVMSKPDLALQTAENPHSDGEDRVMHKIAGETPPWT